MKLLDIDEMHAVYGGLPGDNYPINNAPPPSSAAANDVATAVGAAAGYLYGLFTGK